MVCSSFKRAERWPDTDVMMMTAHGAIEIAVEAMKCGAIDFITKPFPHEALRLKVQNVLEYRQARIERSRLGEENRYLREEIMAAITSGRWSVIPKLYDRF